MAHFTSIDWLIDCYVVFLIVRSIDWLIGWMLDWFFSHGSLIDWLIDWLFATLTFWSFARLIDWLGGCWIDFSVMVLWLIDWLIGWLVALCFLCTQNELPDDSLKTTSSDLEGFWDLLCIQIHKSHRVFEEVYEPTSKSATPPVSSTNGDSPDAARKTGKSGDAKVESRSGSRRGSSEATAAGAGGPRRSSKPKVTFQLTEKDKERKELIAAKRREFEQQQQQQQVTPTSSTNITASTEADVHIFVPSTSSVPGNWPSVLKIFKKKLFFSQNSLVKKHHPHPHHPHHPHPHPYPHHLGCVCSLQFYIG